MKVISIKQPWASLIAHGIKDIENRTWKCPQKYIGQRVLIHASMAVAKTYFIPKRIFINPKVCSILVFITIEQPKLIRNIRV